MKVKLNPGPCRQATSKTSGKPFFIAQAELPDEGGDWKSCRWTIISDKPIPAGLADYSVSSYDSMRGEGRARPLV